MLAGLTSSLLKPRATGGGHVPPNILLQWHVTERCNERCKHCYHESYNGSKDLKFEQLIEILDQFIELLDECDRRRGGGRTRAHVTVSGGEVFLRNDFLDLLDLLTAYRARFSFAILTNGTFIDDRLARHLHDLRPRFMQVSMDGVKETHDKLRGAGNFEKVCEGIRHLVRHKVPTMISFTANRANFREYPAVSRIGADLGVNMVWSDRFIPFGKGSAIREELMTPEETKEYVELVSAAAAGLSASERRRTRVASHRALQFLGGGERTYSCTAGDTLLTVMSNGDLVPCRRLPIPVGNLTHERMVDLYWSHELLKRLRRKDEAVNGCQGCGHTKSCNGGLRCLSYAVHGDPFQSDPGCWIAASK